MWKIEFSRSFSLLFLLFLLLPRSFSSISTEVTFHKQTLSWKPVYESDNNIKEREKNKHYALSAVRGNAPAIGTSIPSLTIFPTENPSLLNLSTNFVDFHDAANNARTFLLVGCRIKNVPVEDLKCIHTIVKDTR